MGLNQLRDAALEAVRESLEGRGLDPSQVSGRDAFQELDWLARNGDPRAFDYYVGATDRECVRFMVLSWPIFTDQDQDHPQTT